LNGLRGNTIYRLYCINKLKHKQYLSFTEVVSKTEVG
jgi:hypothetical protein